MTTVILLHAAVSRTAHAQRQALSTIFMRCLVAVALVATSAGAHAQLEGTLFTKPDERAYLDYLRDEFLRNNAEAGFDIEEATVPVVPGEESAEPTGPTQFSFGGIMTRRDGSRSLWLNGVLLAESELPAGMSLVNAGNSTSLRITHEGKVYELRPGQTVDFGAGSVMENYQRPQTVTADAGSASAPQNAEAAESEGTAGDQATEGAEESASTSETGIAGTIDALTSAVDDLDDSQIAALFEALQTLRPPSEAEEDEADESADAEEP